MDRRKPETLIDPWPQKNLISDILVTLQEWHTRHMVISIYGDRLYSGSVQTQIKRLRILAGHRLRLGKVSSWALSHSFSSIS